MHTGSGLTFSSQAALLLSRQKLGVPYSSVATVSASRTIASADFGALLLCETGGSDITLTLPALSALPQGFSCTMRKNSATPQRIFITTGSAILIGLYSIDDYCTIVHAGTQWIVSNQTDVCSISGLNMVSSGTLVLNVATLGVAPLYRINLNSFVGATTENNIIDLQNARVGQTFEFFVRRDSTAGTKTINFAGTGRTYQRNWGTGTRSIAVNQRWFFSARVVSPTEIWVIATQN